MLHCPRCKALVGVARQAMVADIYKPYCHWCAILLWNLEATNEALRPRMIDV